MFVYAATLHAAAGSQALPVTFLVAAAPASRPTNAIRGPQEGHTSFADYFSQRDYPFEALQNDEEGTVGFQLEVASDGSVTDCTITQSSGAASLDETTCRILLERLRFRPTIGPAGRPIDDVVNASVTWRIVPPRRRSTRSRDVFLRARPVQPLSSYLSHQDFPQVRGAGDPPTPVSRFRLDIAPDGSAHDCKIVDSSWFHFDRLACELMVSRVRFTPARDAEGNAVADRYWGHINWQEFEGLSSSPTASGSQVE